MTRAQSRFFGKVRQGPDCWLWIGAKSPDGYGSFWWDLVVQKSHRVSWQIHFGPIPDGLLVCHRCDNPSCVNPAHLFLGTAKDNTADCMQKGRRNTPVGHTRPADVVRRIAAARRETLRLHPEVIPRGVRSHRAKFTADQVREIRALYPATSARRIAKQLGVATTTITGIVHRRTYVME